MAERIHYKSFMIFTLIVVGVSHPSTGHWIWGGGWLASLGTPMLDFAGSTVVHAVGEAAGLAGMLGKPDFTMTVKGALAGLAARAGYSAAAEQAS